MGLKTTNSYREHPRSEHPAGGAVAAANASLRLSVLPAWVVIRHCCHKAPSIGVTNVPGNSFKTKIRPESALP